MLNDKKIVKSLRVKREMYLIKNKKEDFHYF